MQSPSHHRSSGGSLDGSTVPLRGGDGPVGRPRKHLLGAVRVLEHDGPSADDGECGTVVMAQSISPARRAAAAASVRFSTRSFWKMRETWTLTVLGLMKSCSPI